MTELFKKQVKFVHMVCQLLHYANRISTADKQYVFTFDHAYRAPECNRAIGGHPNSLHTKRLAIDLNLFLIEGDNVTYLTETKDHEPFGLFWEDIGGSWGGRFEDGNHYSLEFEGMK